MGQGFEVEKVMTGVDEQGAIEWKERWIVVRSDRSCEKATNGFFKAFREGGKSRESHAAQGDGKSGGLGATFK